MQPDTFYYVSSAFIVGLLGGGHCVGMCGGIMNALVYALPESQRRLGRVLPLILLYNFGRIFSYALAGAVIGFLAGWMQIISSPVGMVARVAAGLMLILMGLYLAGWWRGLAYLERLGGGIWRRIQPMANRLMPVQSPRQALLLGVLWGWLPCGLVYSALTLSAAVGNWWESALVMMAFGLGTLPTLMLTGVFAHKLKSWLQKTLVRNISALMVIAFGLWTLAMPLSHRAH